MFPCLRSYEEPAAVYDDEETKSRTRGGEGRGGEGRGGEGRGGEGRGGEGRGGGGEAHLP